MTNPLHAEPAPTPQSPAALAGDAQTARQLRILAELADMGLTLARAAFIRAQNHPSAANDRAYASLDRTVRQTLALEGWITRTHTAEIAERAKTQARADAVSTHRRLRQHVEQKVAAGPGFTRHTRFRFEALMTDAGIEASLRREGLAESVARICRELGLTPEQIGTGDFTAPAPAKSATSQPPAPPAATQAAPLLLARPKIPSG